MLKKFALQTADPDPIGAAVPLGQLLFQIYRQGVGPGWGDADCGAVQKVAKTMSHREPT